MDDEVYCSNHSCGRRSRLGADVLGRRFRCRYCGRLLPKSGRVAYGIGAWSSRGTDSKALITAGNNAERVIWEGEAPAEPNLESGSAGASPSRIASKTPAPGELFTRLREEIRSSSQSIAPTFGRYQIRGLLGTGSCATVYRAYDPVVERDVAMKIPHPGAVSGPKAQARFLGEAKALARLRHPGIVPLYDAGRFGDIPYIATAYIDGRTLKELIEEGPIPFQRVADLVAELAEALAYIHGEGIVHRDVKPANVLVDSSGTVQLTDFGLSHRQDASRLTRNGALIGTPAYLAPEQAIPEGATAHPLSDQYSLGVVLYELLCGRPPFIGPPSVVIFNARHEPPSPPRSLRPEIPTGLERICLKAMARSPRDRYSTCAALAEDLRRWQAGRRVVAEGSERSLTQWIRGKPSLAMATAMNRFGLTASAILATALMVPTSIAEDSRMKSPTVEKSESAR